MTFLKLLKAGCEISSFDLKDAFFTVPVHNLLEWKQKFYNFVGMSNGYFDAMIIFTKISKPVLDT